MEINPERRKFLKFLLIGGGAFLAGFLTRSLGPVSKLLGSKKSEIQKDQTEKDLENWKVIERNKEVLFIDKKTGEEMFILDQGDNDK